MSGLCGRERSLFGDGILRCFYHTEDTEGITEDTEGFWACCRGCFEGLFLVEALLGKGYEVYRFFWQPS